MKRLMQSFRYAFCGLRTAFQTEQNLRIYAAVTVLLLICSFYFNLALWEWAVLLLTIGIMYICELFNTAIERVVDLVTEEYHPLAKQAKDIAAGACLFFASVSVVIGIIIFFPKIFL